MGATWQFSRTLSNQQATPVRQRRARQLYTYPPQMSARLGFGESSFTSWNKLEHRMPNTCVWILDLRFPARCLVAASMRDRELAQIHDPLFLDVLQNKILKATNSKSMALNFIAIISAVGRNMIRVHFTTLRIR